MIDARKGLLEQSYRHFYISHLLLLKRVIFAVNKMDLVDYDQDRFLEIAVEVQRMVEGIVVPRNNGPSHKDQSEPDRHPHATHRQGVVQAPHPIQVCLCLFGIEVRISSKKQERFVLFALAVMIPSIRGDLRTVREIHEMVGGRGVEWNYAASSGCVLVQPKHEAYSDTKRLSSA